MTEIPTDSGARGHHGGRTLLALPEHTALNTTNHLGYPALQCWWGRGSTTTRPHVPGSIGSFWPEYQGLPRRQKKKQCPVTHPGICTPPGVGAIRIICVVHNRVGCVCTLPYGHVFRPSSSAGTCKCQETVRAFRSELTHFPCLAKKGATLMRNGGRFAVPTTANPLLALE